MKTSASRNALALQRISKIFAEVLEDATFQVHSLGEGRTTRGVPLVDGYSSRIGIDEDEFDEIASDHATMSKFVSADDPGYHKIQSVLSRWTEDARTSRSARHSQDEFPGPSSLVASFALMISCPFSQ